MCLRTKKESLHRAGIGVLKLVSEIWSFTYVSISSYSPPQRKVRHLWALVTSSPSELDLAECRVRLPTAHRLVSRVNRSQLRRRLPETYPFGCRAIWIATKLGAIWLCLRDYGVSSWNSEFSKITALKLLNQNSYCRVVILLDKTCCIKLSNRILDVFFHVTTIAIACVKWCSSLNHFFATFWIIE